MSMPCPLDGKCIYNTYPTTEAITELAVKPHRNEVEEERLQRYRGYLRELWGGGS